MNLDLLLWSIPGLFTQFLLEKARRRNNVLSQKSTWQYVFELVPLSVLCFILSGLAIRGIENLIGLRYYACARGFWHEVICDYPGSFRLLVAAVVIPYFSARFAAFFAGVGLSLVPRSTRNDPGVLLYEDLVFITLKNRKVYAGYLLDATDKTERLGIDLLSVVPIMSGYRKAEDHCLVYDTRYPVSKGESPFIIHVAQDEIVTISKFDLAIHKKFVDQGRTIIDFAGKTKKDASPRS